MFKLRSTRTVVGLFSAMLGLILLVVLLHGFGLPADRLGERSNQLMVFGRGEFLAALFAALLGAMSITAEIRHGTIRPTFLVNPRRGRVVAAKVLANSLIGGAFGLVACSVAAGAGVAVLHSRAIDVGLDGGDYALLIAGGTVAAALWAAIGVGIGAIVRNQVPTLIGICAWVLFVEGLLVGDVAGIRKVGRFAPGAAGQALSGQFPGVLLGAVAAGLLLAAYAVVAAVVGAMATTHRDVQ
jgi:ABC-type transport system involved in multi-copper enzyme maturation permease subunit